MRPLRLISWGIVLAVVVHAAATYASLPDRIPLHTNLAGEVDRWGARTVWTAFMIPIALVIVVGLLAVVSSWTARRPESVNIPDKEKLVRLPPRYRAPVMIEVQRMMDAAAVVVALTFAMIQWEFTRVAQAGGAKANVLVLIAPMFLTIGLLLFVGRITTALDDADRAWREAGSPPQ